MRTYIATYQSARGSLWDLEIEAESREEAENQALSECINYGELIFLTKGAK